MRHLDFEISELKTQLLTMASHAEKALSDSVRSLLERDDNLARSVKENDNIIDTFEIEVDEAAIQLLSKAPLATDLRFITVAMKISQNLERIADEATKIARRSIDLNQEPQLKAYVDIPRMAGIALEMLKASLDAFVNKQPEKAVEVIDRDKQVDEINKQFHRELSSFMIENPATITRCLNLMVVSKALERIADHSTNIAEEVVYLYEARDIRHGGGGK
jgi:phosphate transport system protein